MGNRNYSRFSSNKFNQQNNKAEQSIAEEPVLQDEEANKVLEEILEPEVKKGRVFNCNLLYLRGDASKESDSLTILSRNEEVELFIKESTNDFYKVKTSSDIYGYCMKQYIKLS